MKKKPLGQLCTMLSSPKLSIRWHSAELQKSEFSIKKFVFIFIYIGTCTPVEGGYIQRVALLKQCTNFLKMSLIRF